MTCGIITDTSYAPNCDQDFLGEKNDLDWSNTGKYANKQNIALHTIVQAHGVALLLLKNTDFVEVAIKKASESSRMKAYLKNIPHTANTQ